MSLDKLKARANAHLQSKEFKQAGELFNRIVRKDPQDIEAWMALAAIHGMSHAYADAESCSRRALRINPQLPGAWLNLGSAQSAQGNYSRAADSYRKVIELQPNTVIAYHSLGNALRKVNSHMEAVHVFNQALVLQPQNSDIYYDLGNTYKACGEISKAIACFRHAMQFISNKLQAHANLIACMLYSDDTNQQELFREQVAWGRAMERNLPNPPCYKNTRVINRRLRIGYCSPDFRNHSVAFFFEPLLEAHDRDRIETFCYSQVEQPDATTERLHTLADHWRDTCGMSNEELYASIRSDEVDILVDLAGLTHGNRIEVFVRRPAPVQLNYLGYASTTGLTSMQYRFTDKWADPPGEADDFHTEKLVRLPHGFLCYRPPDDAPEVATLPALESGQITFGSFNNLVKVTPAVVRFWSGLLKAVPESRLICKAERLSDTSICQRYMELFKAHDIPADRVELLGQVNSVAEHLDLYRRIDIGLDTFPYNGTTTTCEALWMGVPVIVLEGDRHMARVGVSVLQHAGLERFIARDSNEYISIVADLAQDLGRLAVLRAGLRNRLEQSPLCDATAFARDVESAYRDFWEAWVDHAIS
mgnify:CR=1 FL=1